MEAYLRRRTMERKSAPQLGRSRRPAKPVCNGGEYSGSVETTGYRTIPIQSASTVSHTVDVEMEKVPEGGEAECTTIRDLCRKHIRDLSTSSRCD